MARVVAQIKFKQINVFRGKFRESLFLYWHLHDMFIVSISLDHLLKGTHVPSDGPQLKTIYCIFSATESDNLSIFEICLLKWHHPKWIILAKQLALSLRSLSGHLVPLISSIRPQEILLSWESSTNTPIWSTSLSKSRLHWEVATAVAQIKSKQISGFRGKFRASCTCLASRVYERACSRIGTSMISSLHQDA